MTSVIVTHEMRTACAQVRDPRRHALPAHTPGPGESQILFDGRRRPTPTPLRQFIEERRFGKLAEGQEKGKAECSKDEPEEDSGLSWSLIAFDLFNTTPDRRQTLRQLHRERRALADDALDADAALVLLDDLPADAQAQPGAAAAVLVRLSWS